jgi:catechol 2,3-dioxygenase-like lactoylglutathione lyase family enzyme
MSHWPDGLSVVQVRIARPTDRLEEVVSFYRDALGLQQLGSFEHHAGYDGVMLGLPGREYHLEFTRRAGGGPCPAPSKDNLLVLYVEDREAMNKAAERLKTRGHHPVPPENPYWAERGLTFEDPDGWRVVLMNTAGLGGGS